MRQIAAAAGVSVMTVSRALRNSPLITDAVKRLVKETARKLGYRPDAQIAKLMSHIRQRHKPALAASLAAITSIDEADEPHGLTKTRLNAQMRAEELGYRLEVFRVETPAQFNRQLQRTLSNRGIEGVLLLQMHARTDMADFLNWDKFSTVVASASVTGPDFPRIGINHFHNAGILCAQLAAKGCKRIGFVGSETFDVRTGHAFVSAVARQNMAGGITPLSPLLVAGSEYPAEGEFTRWLKREKPDAIIVPGTAVFLFLSEKLRSTTGRRPLFACTNINTASAKLPGIDERHEIVGRTAIDVLTGLINRNEKNQRTLHANTLINGRWFDLG